MNAIKIVAIPPGEASRKMREAWVGLRLPLSVPGVKSALVMGGVVMRPKTYLTRLFRQLLGRCRRETGYFVNIVAAIGILGRKNPSDAEWWRENHPELLQPGNDFLFSVEAREVTESEIVATFYNARLSGVSEDGTFSIKTSWHDEFGMHMTGFTRIKPNEMDYQLWQWIIRRWETNAPSTSIINIDTLSGLRAEFIGSSN